MRLFVTVAVLGLMAAVPAAMAQNTTTTTSVPYAAPMYNAQVNGTTYYQNSVSGAPIYNNASPSPLPLNQMAAGKNAPSYNYNGARPYTGFMGGDPLAGADFANLTPDQRRLIDQQAAVRAQQEQAYYNNLQQQQMLQQQQAMGNPYAQGLGQTYNNLTQSNDQKPKQRRVVYNERNNPLTTPPRLFNPDQ